MTYPIQIIPSLKSYSLTLPISEKGTDLPKVVQSLANYCDPAWFFVNTLKNCVVLNVNVDMCKGLGATTANSVNLRSELRELDINGKNASWNLSDQTLHILESTMSVDAYSGKGVVIAQCHGGVKKPNMELRLIDGNFLVENHQNKQGTKNVVVGILSQGYVIGTKFVIKIVAGNSKIDVYFNGSKKISFASKFPNQFFKIGAYDQSGIKPGSISTVSLYNLSTTTQK